MDTLKIVKVLKDGNLIELKIEASSKYISVNQYCYLQDTDLEDIGNRIRDFSFSYTRECYVEFGRKQGNYTPAFSLRFLPLGTAERVKIEVDMEIDDNEERKHRCCFYIMSELGLIAKFGDSIAALATQNSNVAVMNR